VDRVSIIVGCRAGFDRRGDLSGCSIRVGPVEPLPLTERQQRCPARMPPPAHERRPRSEDLPRYQTSSTRPLNIAGGSGGRAKPAAAPSSRCAIALTSTARTAFAGGTSLGPVINGALVARRVEGGSSSLELTPRCGTTRGWPTGWCACRVALFAVARSCRLRSGGSTPPGLRCTELRATSPSPTTRSRRPRRRSAGKSGETVRPTGPRKSPARGSLELVS
jgi:hypothetical protein